MLMITDEAICFPLVPLASVSKIGSILQKSYIYIVQPKKANYLPLLNVFLLKFMSSTYDNDFLFKHFSHSSLYELCT